MVPKNSNNSRTKRGEEVYIGIGSNLDPEDNIRRSIPEIQSRMEILAASRFYRNPAYCPEPDTEPLPFFINGVLRVRTAADPWRFKCEILREIEQTLGRNKDSWRFAPRTLDVDLLVYDDFQLQTRSLVLPDPDIFLHPFWAIPLTELLPHLSVPGTCLKLKQITEKMDVQPLEYMESLTIDVHRMIRDPSKGEGQKTGGGRSKGRFARNDESM